jgi:C1A family cysteine protease
MHNNANETHKVAINSFADWAPSEFKKLSNLQVPIENDSINSVDEEDVSLGATLIGAPASVNWVTAGAVGPVRNQGSCSSCYAFSSAAAMEGIYKIKHSVLY